MNNPLTPLARRLGQRPALMRMAPMVVRVDGFLDRLSRGRLSLVRLAGLPSAQLRTTGRKTGECRSINVLCYPHRGGYVVIGSNWGRRADPAWTLNLRAQPQATIRVRGTDVRVTARTITGDEYRHLWPQLVRFWPGYAMERAKAGRPLPIFLLTPRAR